VVSVRGKITRRLEKVHPHIRMQFHDRICYLFILSFLDKLLFVELLQKGDQKAICATLSRYCCCLFLCPPSAVKVAAGARRGPQIGVFGPRVFEFFISVENDLQPTSNRCSSQAGVWS
jgi:hypothetical protein